MGVRARVTRFRNHPSYQNKRYYLVFYWRTGLLSSWEIVGVIVLAGPLFVVLVILVYLGVKTGISDWRRGLQEMKEVVGVGNRLIGYQGTDMNLQRYLEEVRGLADVGDGEVEDGMFFFIKWLIRIIILPFALLSFEAFRTFNVLWSGGVPFVPHALVLAVLSSSIVVVSAYYGFFVKYG